MSTINKAENRNEFEIYDLYLKPNLSVSVTLTAILFKFFFRFLFIYLLV